MNASDVVVAISQAKVNTVIRLNPAALFEALEQSSDLGHSDDLFFWQEGWQGKWQENDPKFIASVARLGVRTPVAVTKDRMLGNGHHRLIAAVRLGLEEIPVLVVEDTWSYEWSKTASPRYVSSEGRRSSA